MNSVKRSILINKPAQEVFSFLINPENTPKWVKGVTQEMIDRMPIQLGTVYKNQSLDGDWSEFVVTDFTEGQVFELTKKDDHHHVKTTFKELEPEVCELEYCVWVESGEIGDRFSQNVLETILKDLKVFMESQ